MACISHFMEFPPKKVIFVFTHTFQISQLFTLFNAKFDLFHYLLVISELN